MNINPNLSWLVNKIAGGSDANSLNKKGIKTVNIGIGAQNPHSYDEFILLEDLKAASDIVCEIIKG